VLKGEPLARVAVLEGLPATLSRGLADVLRGAERILVAGGIADRHAVDQLSGIAPVTAVVAHRDFLALGDVYPESATLEVGGARIYLAHMIGTPPEFLPPVRELLAHDPPDVIAHGHAPRAHVVWIGGTLFVCPGRATPAAGHAATCALLDIEGPGRITAHVLEIP
jgi:uncharacterized protein